MISETIMSLMFWLGAIVLFVCIVLEGNNHWGPHKKLVFGIIFYLIMWVGPNAVNAYYEDNLEHQFMTNEDRVITEENYSPSTNSAYPESAGYDGSDPNDSNVNYGANPLGEPDDGNYASDNSSDDSSSESDYNHVEPHYVDSYYRDDGTQVDGYWRGGDDGYWRSNP